jgi:hypothetical protein
LSNPYRAQVRLEAGDEDATTQALEKQAAPAVT